MVGAFDDTGVYVLSKTLNRWWSAAEKLLYVSIPVHWVELRRLQSEHTATVHVLSLPEISSC